MAAKRKQSTNNNQNTRKRLKRQNDHNPKAMAMDMDTTLTPYHYLPDLVINQILQLLPSKLAAQASTLSKQWADVWSSIPVLDFDEDKPYDHNKLDKLQRKQFITFVKKCLKRRETHKLLDKFRLRMRYCGGAKSIDKWLSFAVNRKVKELDMSLRTKGRAKRYSVPQTLFDAKSLTTLNLEHMRIESSSFDQPISLPCLKSISFKMVRFDGMALSNLISGCPCIESLSLDTCDLGSSIHEFKISSSSLKSLEISLCNSFHIKIKAGNLESFTFVSDSLLPDSISLLDCRNLKYITVFSQHLKHLTLYALVHQNSVQARIDTPNLVSFDFSGYLKARVSMVNAPLKNLSESTILLFDHSRGPIFNWPLEYFSTLRDYLENFGSSKKLKLYIHDVEGFMFPEDFRKAFSSPLPNVNHLEIVTNSAIEGTESELRESLHWLAPSVENPSIESLSGSDS